VNSQHKHYNQKKAKHLNKQLKQRSRSQPLKGQLYQSHLNKHNPRPISISWTGIPSFLSTRISSKSTNLTSCIPSSYQRISNGNAGAAGNYDPGLAGSIRIWKFQKEKWASPNYREANLARRWEFN